mmetsp:Transcript_23680/g.75885  ORF Transcript_23680/g.75885 Transcript_23680/m.75885 type:complete len:391 (+) Transcript_23680:23-1195(+)
MASFSTTSRGLTDSPARPLSCMRLSQTRRSPKKVGRPAASAARALRESNQANGYKPAQTPNIKPSFRRMGSSAGSSRSAASSLKRAAPESDGPAPKRRSAGDQPLEAVDESTALSELHASREDNERLTCEVERLNTARSAWEGRAAEQAAELERLHAEIEAARRELSAQVTAAEESAAAAEAARAAAQAEAEAEGVPPPQFDAEAVSNVSTITLFSAPHSGLFALLNEECVFPKGTDESFVTKLHAANKEHSRLSVLQPEGSAFRVAHYAGIVTYKAKGFLVKNKARARLLPRPPLTRRRSPPHVRSRRPSRRTCSSSSAPQATGPAPAAPRRHLNSSSSCRLPPSPQASPSSQRSSRKRRPRLRWANAAVEASAVWSAVTPQSSTSCCG